MLHFPTEYPLMNLALDLTFFFFLYIFYIGKTNKRLRERENLPIKSKHFIEGRVLKREEVKDYLYRFFLFNQKNECCGWFYASPVDTFMIVNSLLPGGPAVKIKHLHADKWEVHFLQA